MQNANEHGCTEPGLQCSNFLKVKLNSLRITVSVADCRYGNDRPPTTVENRCKVIILLLKLVSGIILRIFVLQ